MNPQLSITQELKSAVTQVLCMQIITEATRKEVRQYQTAWLAKYQPRAVHCNSDPEAIITDPEESWKMSDDLFKEYDAANEAEAIKLGYEIEPGQCPLLVSVELLRQAQRQMVEAGLYLMPGMTTEAVYRNPIRWEKVHSLLIKATVSFFGKESMMEEARKLAGEKI